MILDQLDQAARYAGLGAGFASAFRFLQTLDGSRPDGRCEIDGDAVYATLMSYESKVPAGPTHEVHRKYADVQFLLSGQETMHFTPAGRLGPGNGYQEEKDYELCDAPVRPSTLTLQAGQFAIFFPGEGHQPGLALGTPAPVRKVVVKVKI
jgi:YhcH/YjgK/YiaL family protein